MKYDLIVVGAGPGGYNCALKASSFGIKTLLVEKAHVGGTCLNNGCIPTKSLLKSAVELSNARRSELISFDNLAFSCDKMFEKKDKVISKLQKGIEFLLKKASVDLVTGTAKFVSENTIDVDGTVYEFEKAVIATGTVPAKLRIEGNDHVVDSDFVLHNEVAGDDVVIIGGGVVGVELASYLSFLGKSVTVLEFQSEILTGIDADAVKTLKSALKKQGIKILTGASVQKVELDESKKTVIAIQKDKTLTLSADQVISAVGRDARLGSLSLESAGVEYDRKIVVNEFNQTSNKNIFSIGDSSARIMLAHFAEAEGVNTACYLAGQEPVKDMSVVPSAIYTHPEVACVGKTEVDEDCYAQKAMMSANGKANIENCLDGFVKVVFDKTDTIIGGVVVGSRATDMISELSLAIANKLSKEDIAKVIHPHPTLSECIGVAVD